ncbi:MAG: Efflux transporter, RND family, MFP subunit [Candidatus Levybacteria bacterium GW2011_GWA2_36_13]|nr:MAG: Efflux transporter, RND family, MFP subunit [Candidatus Levybacteria bacterium GW2011_GWA2_36_13]
MPVEKLLKFVKKHKKILPIALIPILILVFFVFPKNKSTVPTSAVENGDVVKLLSVTGKVASESSVNLSFQIAGKLVYLPFKKGDTVSANQTIAALDQRSVQKNVQDELLSYSKQRATFEQTLKDYNASKISDAVSDTIKRTLEKNQYDLEKAVLSLELDALVREQSFLITPISGILTRMDATATGVNAKTTDVFTVTDPNSLVFQIDVDEADIGSVTEGQTVDVTLDAFPNDALSLTVDKIDFVSHTTTSGGNAFTVEARLPENSNYRVGMSGDADVIVDSQRGVLTVPSTSIVDDSFVYVKKGKYFEKRSIDLGLQSDTDVEVLSGLSEGEEIATDSNLVLPGMVLK